MPGFFIHQHREINIHIFIQVNMAEDNGGVKRGGVSGEFKVSSRELQASKAKRDCLDYADNTFRIKKSQEEKLNENKRYPSSESTDLIVVYDRIRTTEGTLKSQ